MSGQRERLFASSISLLVLILVTLPYVVAVQPPGSDFVFNGFLLNPLDGNSYLAKMHQGWGGSWRFKLPFTADPGEGAYLFLFYLFLGHVARIANLPLLLVFHLARVLGVIILLWTLWRFFSAIYPESRPRKLAFALAALGSGMGWMLIPFGAFTADFWVAETYPFLSSYANPHFPLGLALLLGLVMPPLERALNWRNAAMTAVGALTLSLIDPFGVVVALMVLGGQFLWSAVSSRLSGNTERQDFRIRSSVVGRRLLTVFLFGAPTLLYDFWVANTDPAFKIWNAQNLTPSPPLWDLVFSLSPALLMALLGAWSVSSRRRSAPVSYPPSPVLPLIIWAGFGLILLYLPIGLQRRFMMGLYIPLAGLAALGLEVLTRAHPRRYRSMIAGLFLLALLTNLVILLAALHGVQTRDPQIYLTQGETQTLSWIAGNTLPDALVLSSPDTGLLIPAYTGRRVIYGHPFETVDAEVEEEAVIQFFTGDISEEQMQGFLQDRDVDYIFFGPRERSLGDVSLSQEWEIAFASGDVVLYRVGE